jgi:hypothetical protein
MAYGSWLSDITDAIGGVVAGDGNTPGNADTRKLGYDPQQVAQASAAILQQPSGANVQQELLVMGIAGVALIFLLRSGKRRY